MKQVYDLFNKDVYKHLKVACIYKLTTPHNNLCYVGSTVNYAKRMKDHRNDLKKKRHASSYLQNVVSKYSECFTEILEHNKIIFCGNGMPKCKEILSKHPNAIFSDAPLSAKNMIKTALQMFDNEQFDDVAYFEPFYLKEYLPGKSVVKGLR